MNITLIAGDSCNDKEKLLIPQIEAQIFAAINMQEFHDFMCDPENGLDLDQTNGQTAEEVVATIRTYLVSATIEYYYEDTDIIGYRNEGESVIWCNRKFHDDYSILDESSNVGHEATHLMGYFHDFDYTDRRPFSVCYRFNAFMQKQFNTED